MGISISITISNTTISIIFVVDLGVNKSKLEVGFFAPLSREKIVDKHKSFAIGHMTTSRSNDTMDIDIDILVRV